MIGNDIIDLRLAAQESNWQRKGYLGKIFTATEQEMICRAAAPSDMVWLLWSCKEAAYKIVNRVTNVRAYNPTKFDCTLLHEEGDTVITGKIAHASRNYAFISHLDHHYIHTVAVAHEIFFSCLDIYTSNSWPLHLPDQCTLMKNQDGIPYMNCCSNTSLPVSISHHGDYYGLVKKKALI